ncbi:MAG: hypothetical protein WCD38_01865 [Candidatus Tumulicola sp.]
MPPRFPDAFDARLVLGRFFARVFVRGMCVLVAGAFTSIGSPKNVQPTNLPSESSAVAFCPLPDGFVRSLWSFSGDARRAKLI